jgi:hypothetical protein
MTTSKIFRVVTLVAAFGCVSFQAGAVDKKTDSKLRDPCVANLIGSIGELSANNEKSFAEGMIFEQSPVEVATLIKEKHRPATSVVFSIPLQHSEYEAVFSKHNDELTHAESRQISSAAKLASNAGLRTSQSVLSRTQFQSFLGKQHGDFVIISGHNERGKFTFIGGEKVALPLLGEDCTRANKTCIFISCESKDYLHDGSIGVARELTLAEGVWITQKISAWLESQRSNQVSLESLRMYVRQVEFEANLRFHVSYFILGACATAGTPIAAHLIIEGVENR